MFIFLSLSLEILYYKKILGQIIGYFEEKYYNNTLLGGFYGYKKN